MRNPERLKAVLRLGGFAVAVVLLVSFVSTSCAPPQNSPLPPAGVPPVTGYDTVEDLISDPRLMVFRPPFPAGLAEAGSRNFGGRVLVTGKAVCQKVKDTKPVSKQITKDGATTHYSARVDKEGKKIQLLVTPDGKVLKMGGETGK